MGIFAAINQITTFCGSGIGQSLYASQSEKIESSGDTISNGLIC
jgi:hypothetical protein